MRIVEGGGNNFHCREVSQNEALLTYDDGCEHIEGAVADRIEIVDPIVALRYERVDGRGVQECSSLVMAGTWDSPTVPYYLDLNGVVVVDDGVSQRHVVHHMN